jgi:two-component system chemotaxis response regulator CheY
MMDKLHIVCVDENVEITFNLLRDLASLAESFTLSQCNSAEDAITKLDAIDKEGDFVALVISGLLQCPDNPSQLLTMLAGDIRFWHSKKVLITDDISKELLFNAINVAHINRLYETKWDGELLLQQARILVTDYVFAKGLDYEQYQSHLDSETILKHMRRRI